MPRYVGEFAYFGARWTALPLDRAARRHLVRHLLGALGGHLARSYFRLDDAEADAGVLVFDAPDEAAAAEIVREAVDDDDEAGRFSVRRLRRRLHRGRRLRRFGRGRALAG